MLKVFDSAVVKALALALLLLGSFAGIMYLDNQAKAARVAELRVERDAAQIALQTLADTVRENTRLVEVQRRELATLRNAADAALEDVINAPPEADAPIAPVLADALAASRRMWDDAGIGPAAALAAGTSGPLPRTWTASASGDPAVFSSGDCAGDA